MSTIVDIPDLTSEQIKSIFKFMDVYLNQILLAAFLDVSPEHFKVERRKIIMVVAIIFLYITEIINLSVRWWSVSYAFIKNEWNFWEVFLGLQVIQSSFLWMVLVVEISGTIATIIVDTIIIWRCWTVWDRRWLIVLLPILCTLIATESKNSDWEGPSIYNYILRIEYHRKQLYALYYFETMWSGSNANAFRCFNNDAITR
ncbi:hypothetical protein ARMSODRAFT_976388 [Armillaria solidipes]|uniref:Uncharacterized protein n=1 Tax=Armillaria solidipes TaxID=1076256 RepID=A0A2H3BB96_9AGAR|nr:hypothetical protein ARMSODRAFT_976388 [Armillaria solidipes]